MSKRLYFFSAILALSFAVTGPIYSCPAGEETSVTSGSTGKNPRVDSLHNQMKAFRQAQGAKILELRKKIDLELKKPSPDKKLLDSYISKQVELRSSITKKWMESLIKIKDMVSAQEYSQYVDGNWGCGCGDADCAGVPKKKAGVELKE